MAQRSPHGNELLGSPDTSHAQVDPNEAGFCHGPARRGWQGFARFGMGLISTHWDPARVRVQRPPLSNTGPKWAGCWCIKISMLVRTCNSTSLPPYRWNQPCFWDFLTSLSVPPNTIQRITSTRRDMRAPFAWVSDVFDWSFFKFLCPLPVALSFWMNLRQVAKRKAPLRARFASRQEGMGRGDWWRRFVRH